MFETVAPETFTTRSRRLMYETLPLSLAVHGLAIAAGVGAAVWNVGFPEASPRVSVAYSLIRIPDPPPPPLPPRAAPQPAPAKTVAAPPPPKVMLFAQELAPVIIPEKIQPVEIPPPPEPPVPQPAVAEAATGVPNGSSAGSVAGDLAGKLHGTPGGIIFPDGRLHIDRDEKLPMDPVEQDFPHYPHEAQKKGLEDQVVVRYVIGTDGRVKELEIIDHAKEKMFDDAALEAIRHWRFHPMVKDGKRIEVVHELAVNFQLVGH